MIPLKKDRGIDGVIWRDFNYNEPYTSIRKTLSHYDIRKIIDIGASSGLSALYFMDLPTVETIYCIEPDPESFQMLLENLEPVMDYIKAFNIGIYYGLEEGTVGGIGDNSPLGYFVEDMWKEHPLGDASDITYSSKTFKLVELEDIIDIPVDLIKMDCEGSEYNIIEHSSEIYNSKLLLLSFHNHPESFIREFIAQHFPNYKLHLLAGTGAHFNVLLEKL